MAARPPPTLPSKIDVCVALMLLETLWRDGCTADRLDNEPTHHDTRIWVLR